MKIIVLTAVWKRYRITQLFYKWMHYLQQQDYIIDVVSVGSEKAISKWQCEQYGFTYLEHSNQPLGQKWNHGARHLEQLDWDYCLILGSDDFISEPAMALLRAKANNEVDFAGFKDLYFYSSITQKMAFWPGYTNGRQGESCGAGRLISRAVMEQMRYQPWDSSRRKGLDLSMSNHLKHLGVDVSSSLTTEEAPIVDVKSAVNLGAFWKYDDQRVDPDTVWQYFPGWLTDQITSL